MAQLVEDAVATVGGQLKTLERKFTEYQAKADELDRNIDTLLVEGRDVQRPLRKGDEVYVPKIHKWGTIERVDEDKGTALVSCEGMRVKVDLEDLVPWGAKMEG